MASMWFNNGLKLLIENSFFTPVTSYGGIFAALVTSQIPPLKTYSRLGHLREIPEGNGYTAGGIPLGKNTTDFPLITEDPSGFAEVTIRNLVWVSSLGRMPPLPTTGARYLVLTTGYTTAVASRELICAIDLGIDCFVDGTLTAETLTISGAKVRLTQAVDPEANLFTVRGLAVILRNFFQQPIPPACAAVLIDETSVAPTLTTTTLSTLTQCAVGNGYLDGGIVLNTSAAAMGFQNLTESSLTNQVSFQTPLLTWNAVGGQMPVATSNGARWLALTDTGASVGGRNVIATACLKADRAKADGEKLIIPSLTMRLDNV